MAEDDRVVVFQTPENVLQEMETHLTQCERRCLEAWSDVGRRAILTNLMMPRGQPVGWQHLPSCDVARHAWEVLLHSCLQATGTMTAACGDCMHNYLTSFMNGRKSNEVTAWLTRVRGHLRCTDPNASEEAVHAFMFRDLMEQVRDTILVAIEHCYITMGHAVVMNSWPRPGQFRVVDAQSLVRAQEGCKRAIERAFHYLCCLVEDLASL